MAAEWHPVKNQAFNLNPEKIGVGSNKKVWWLCQKNLQHEWQASPDSRSREKLGCPFCSNKRVCKDNSLAIINPILGAEWHPTLNGTLTAYDVTPGSHAKVYWQCKKKSNHVWEKAVEIRNRGIGCPYCANKRIASDNCLAAVNPTLAAEWHPTKNNNLTPYDVTRGTRKKAWWKCPKGHEYESAILSRSYGHGCPECARAIKRNTALKRWKKYKERSLVS